MIITIDGPAGSGKSTLGKVLSKQINFIYIDAGMIFRAFAYYLSKSNSDELPEIEVNEQNEILINNREISRYLLRNCEKSNKILSEIGACEKVKKKVYEIEKKMARKYKNIIFSGRDVGTKVFPEAEIKFYIEVPVNIRARRRSKNDKNYEKVKNFMIKRDKEDIEKGSLLKPEKFIKIKNFNKKLSEVIQEMIEYINI